MKVIAPCIVLLIALSIGIWKYTTSQGNRSADAGRISEATSSKSSRPSSTTKPTDPSIQQSESTDHQESGPTEAQVAAKAAIIEKIHDASTTYDAAYLPVIKPYLLDADPEIRENAVNAMIVLGDASAGKMLRDAAIQMKTAEDVKMMLEAAEFVELPEADLKKFIKRKPPEGETDPGEPRPPRPNKLQTDRRQESQPESEIQDPQNPN